MPKVIRGLGQSEAHGLVADAQNPNPFINAFLINKAIYFEARQMAYQLNIFRFNSIKLLSDFVITRKSQDLAPDSRYLIKNVELALDGSADINRADTIYTIIYPDEYNIFEKDVPQTRVCRDTMRLIFSLLPTVRNITLHAKLWPTPQGTLLSWDPTDIVDL